MEAHDHRWREEPAYSWFTVKRYRCVVDGCDAWGASHAWKRGQGRHVTWGQGMMRVLPPENGPYPRQSWPEGEEGARKRPRKVDPVGTGQRRAFDPAVLPDDDA